VLPTSLSRVPSHTRGCAPWRPAAVIGTAPRGRPPAFQGPCAGGGCRGTLPRPPHALRLGRFPWRGRVNGAGAAPPPPRRAWPDGARRRAPRGLLESWPAPLSGDGRAMLRAVGPPLRAESPTARRSGRGTLLHFSLLGSARILATPSEIGTGGRSRRACARPSTLPPRPLTPRRGAGRAEARGFGAIHFPGGLIRLVGCYTLLGGCRLPWPPPSCPDQPTPFGLLAPSGAPWLGSRVVPPRPFCLPDGAHWPRALACASSRVRGTARVRSLRRGRGPGAPLPRDTLYPAQLRRGRNPERNFRGNQLLDGSMSLSPLRPAPGKDLHVTTPAGLHRAFARLRPGRA